MFTLARGPLRSWNHALLPRRRAQAFPDVATALGVQLMPYGCMRTTEISAKTPRDDTGAELSDYCTLLYATSCKLFLCLCLPLHHGTGEIITRHDRMTGDRQIRYVRYGLTPFDHVCWRFSTTRYTCWIHWSKELGEIDRISEGPPFDLKVIPGVERWEDAHEGVQDTSGDTSTSHFSEGGACPVANATLVHRKAPHNRTGG